VRAEQFTELRGWMKDENSQIKRVIEFCSTHWAQQYVQKHCIGKTLGANKKGPVRFDVPIDVSSLRS